MDEHYSRVFGVDEVTFREALQHLKKIDKTVRENRVRKDSIIWVVGIFKRKPENTLKKIQK